MLILPLAVVFGVAGLLARGHRRIVLVLALAAPLLSVAALAAQFVPGGVTSCSRSTNGPDTCQSLPAASAWSGALPFGIAVGLILLSLASLVSVLARLILVNMFGAGQNSDATFANGSVVQYDTETGKGKVLADAFHNPLLFLPYMAKFGPDGNLYVTAGAICGTDGANPFQGAPFNPCTIGDAKGGRVVKLSLAHGGDSD